jgi:hypothetical protein
MMGIKRPADLSRISALTSPSDGVVRKPLLHASYNMIVLKDPSMVVKFAAKAKSTAQQ